MMESSSLMQAQHDYPELVRKNVSAGKFPDRASTMPLYWSTDDTKRAILATLIPAGAGLITAAALAQDREYQELLETARRPYWAPKPRGFYTAMDIGTLLPLGYASYLVYKYGGGFDYTDTNVALGLYGANLALSLVSVPLAKARNFKGLFVNAALIHLTASAAAIAFYKIENTAGYLSIPWVTWTGFYSLFGYAVWQLNSSRKDL